MPVGPVGRWAVENQFYQKPETISDFIAVLLCPSALDARCYELSFGGVCVVRQPWQRRPGFLETHLSFGHAGSILLDTVKGSAFGQ